MKNRFVRKTSLLGGLTLLLVVFWQVPLLVSLSKPTLISVFPVVAKATSVQADNTFSYPRLGIDAPITLSPTSSPVNYADWPKLRSSMNEGVNVSFERSEFISSPLVFVTGHSSDTFPHRYSTVFASLGQAEIGDSFSINVKGKVYTYKVRQKKILNPAQAEQFSALRPASASGQYVALVTCWPLLTTDKRLVVVGENTVSRN